MAGVFTNRCQRAPASESRSCGRARRSRSTASRRSTEVSHRGIVSRRGPQPTGSYPHAHIQGTMAWVTAHTGRQTRTGDFVPGGIVGQPKPPIEYLAAVLDDLV